MQNYRPPMTSDPLLKQEHTVKLNMFIVHLLSIYMP